MNLVRKSLACGLFLIVGCGAPSDQPELGHVSGTVTMDNEPLAGALVVFGPEEGRSSVAYTDENGHYDLLYLPDTYGARFGKHSVSISTPFEDEDESDPSAEFYVDPIPIQYNKKTTLTAEVKVDEDNEFNFDLKSR